MTLWPRRDMNSNGLEIRGTSKDLIRETSGKLVSMNNRPSDASQAAFADSTSKEEGNHLLRIIIESRFIILANLQALERPAHWCFTERSIGSSNRIVVESRSYRKNL